jgi:hypothetical protein
MEPVEYLGALVDLTGEVGRHAVQAAVPPHPCPQSVRVSGAAVPPHPCPVTFANGRIREGRRHAQPQYRNRPHPSHVLPWCAAYSDEKKCES